MITRRLDVPTSRATERVDITARLQDEVTSAGLLDGRLHLQSLHTTLALTLNAHSDELALLLPACTVLVESGRLVLGRRQSVHAVELDGPRLRQLALQLDGNFMASSEPPPAAPSHRELVELELTRQLLVDPAAVQEPMRRLVGAGGKRLRPLLAMLAARLGPNGDPLRAAALAAAIELIHDATLVHDDYVDEAATRRGRPTVAAREGPARAVAVGDYYFAKATRVIAELGNPDVTTTIADAVEAICLSQMDDVRLRGSYPGDYGMYLRVVRGKTAALFAAACQAGAQLGGSPPDVVERLARFGDLLGIAFQMADDLLDYSASSGKPLGQDIRQRVVSLPLIYATEDAGCGQRVRDLLAGPLEDDQVREVQELVVATGALERVGEEARGLVAAALRELDEIAVDGVQPELADLARSAVDRLS
ncbi:MAG TPA: polyprenyl synthetase family protein [Candidatus Dormibacteraeota bacterium]|nr:polyprenyl synthetase family protein [Candidatus Dormibacteraeota bacterium]